MIGLSLGTANNNGSAAIYASYVFQLLQQADETAKVRIGDNLVSEESEYGIVISLPDTYVVEEFSSAVTLRA